MAGMWQAMPALRSTFVVDRPRSRGRVKPGWCPEGRSARSRRLAGVAFEQRASVRNEHSGGTCTLSITVISRVVTAPLGAKR